MSHHYVWLIWSSAFLAPWIVLCLTNPRLRTMMWQASLLTALLGLTEPLFLPVYRNPRTLFELARRTGFVIESFIFACAVGGIGVALYDALSRYQLGRVPAQGRRGPLHRFHLAAPVVPLATFVALYFLPWNPIYPSTVILGLGAIAWVVCRPELRRSTVLGGLESFSVALSGRAPDLTKLYNDSLRQVSGRARRA